MAFNEHETWMGFGVKGGGILFVAGFDGFEGAACRFDKWADSLTGFNITNFRMGLGLGGSVGATCLLAFNTPMLYMLDGMTIDPSWGDFNVNIALPALKADGKTVSLLAKIGQKLTGLGFLEKAVLGGLKPHDIESLRNFASLCWTAMVDGSEADKAKEVKLIVFDIPGAGRGVEASIFWTKGTVSTNLHWLSRSGA